MKLIYITLSLILAFSLVVESPVFSANLEESLVTVSDISDNNCIGQQGKITWHAWNMIRNGTIEELYNDPYYPTTPDATQTLTQLQSPINYNSQFGAVAKGFIKPSQSGNYIFNLTGDDEGYFLLSTNADPNNLVERCSFPTPTDDIDDHDKFPSQTSISINLNANQYYYFELRHRNRWGGSDATVYWKTPSNNTWSIVPNVNLYQYTCEVLCELPGTPCDDGNASTTNDVYDGFCNCVGIPATNLSCVGERNEIRTLVWKDLNGYGLNLLYNDPDYPSKPDTLEIINRFANPLVPHGDSMGTKTAAYLIAPETGVYTFNVTSDDQSELFLSTNHDPANKTIIASLDRWAATTDHDKYPSQTSAPINLTKGQYYYVEINQQSRSGGEHFNVYWKSDKTNPNTWQVIEGLYLFDYTCDITCIPEGTPCDDGNFNTKNDTYDANCNCVGIPCSNGDCDPTPAYEAYGACDATDKHSQNPKDSWNSCQLSPSPNSSRGNSHWIRYDFGGSYPITSAHIWNYNVAGQTNKGFKNVVIDYSDDGQNWTQLGTYAWPQANGNTNYTGFDGPNFGELNARYILITALDNWGNNSCAGFSQISFKIGGCPDVGLPCDDGNPNTIQDNINTDCSCEGVGAAENTCDMDNLVEGNVVVRAANYGVRLTIESTGIITNGTKVNYVAGESITLNPGFDARSGSDFYAVIMPCNNSLEEESTLSKLTEPTDSPLAEETDVAIANSTQEEAKATEIPLKADLTVMPNPTRSWTTFSFDLPYQSKTSICIYSTSGQQVTCLSNDYIFPAGKHTKEFPAQQLAKGIYYVTLRTEKEVVTKNFVVVD